MVTVAAFVKLQAKPGKEKDIICFLERGLILANQESTKPVWFALQLGSSAFGIPDASLMKRDKMRIYWSNCSCLDG